MTFLLTWQRATGWLLSFFFAILRAHLKITEQQATITAFLQRRSDEKMTPPLTHYCCYILSKTTEFRLSCWMAARKQDDLCCRTHNSVQRNFPKSIRSAVFKTQDLGRASLITHVQAPCWHEKHFCKSHQITVCKVLHEVSEARQKIFPAIFFSLHEITNEPKTGTTTANYSDSIEDGMSHQFTTFLNDVHMNRQKKRWKKKCFTCSHCSLKRKKETVSNRDWQTVISSVVA